MIVTCPHCFIRLKVEDTGQDEVVSCPKCRKGFHVKSESVADIAPAAPKKSGAAVNKLRWSPPPIDDYGTEKPKPKHGRGEVYRPDPREWDRLRDGRAVEKSSAFVLLVGGVSFAVVLALITLTLIVVIRNLRG